MRLEPPARSGHSQLGDDLDTTPTPPLGPPSPPSSWACGSHRCLLEPWGTQGTTCSGVAGCLSHGLSSQAELGSFSHLAAVWPWVSHFTSLSLSFLIWGLNVSRDMSRARHALRSLSMDDSPLLTTMQLWMLTPKDGVVRGPREGRGLFGL